MALPKVVTCCICGRDGIKATPRWRLARHIGKDGITGVCPASGVHVDTNEQINADPVMREETRAYHRRKGQGR